MRVKDILRIAYDLMTLFGIDPLKTIWAIRGLSYYFRDLSKLKKQQKVSNINFDFGRPYPCLGDRFAQSGTASGHYFHQDMLIARRIFLNNPELHVDIGSRIDGFIAHVASFRKIEVFDIRELKNDIPNVKFIRADLMGDIDRALVNYSDSLSCLHALEHFGLGRYGDTVRFDGHIVGLNNMYAILRKGGKFYLSVPIGSQRIEFNAHRVFSLKYLLSLFAQKFKIDAFSFVNDKGDLFENVELSENEVNRNFGCIYGCGIFEMMKL
jgi:SAM-dependent methyltransferase